VLQSTEIHSVAINKIKLPSDTNCGRSKYPDAGGLVPTDRQRFIIGGRVSREHEFPWQVIQHF